MEMTKYFVEQSTRNASMTGSPRPGSRASSLRSEDLVQSEFYKRIGQDPAGDERRQQWQYRSMMDGYGGYGGAGKGFGASPRFSSKG